MQRLTHGYAVTRTQINAHIRGNTVIHAHTHTHARTHTDGLQSEKPNDILMYFYAPETMFTRTETSIPGMSYVQMGS